VHLRLPPFIITSALLRFTPPSAANMARVYADVNQNMPRAYWDYDSVNISESHTPTLMLFASPHPRRACELTVEPIGWGVLENYEVVRKIGSSTLPIRGCPTHRGTVLTASVASYRQGQIFGSFRGYQRGQLPEMRHQGSQAGQEEEDQA
jgi:hypothetical protein